MLEAAPRLGSRAAFGSFTGELLALRTTRHWALYLADRDATAAARAARKLAREGLPHAHVWSTLLSAAVRARASDRDGARTLLGEAIAASDAAGMALCAAAARRRLGQVAASDAFMVAEGVKDPERMTEVVAPVSTAAPDPGAASPPVPAPLRPFWPRSTPPTRPPRPRIQPCPGIRARLRVRGPPPGSRLRRLAP